MGLFDMFSSSPPKPAQPQQVGLLSGQQPAQPNLRDKWLAHKQDAMEQGTPAMTWEQFQKAQQQPKAPK